MITDGFIEIIEYHYKKSKSIIPWVRKKHKAMLGYLLSTHIDYVKNTLAQNDAVLVGDNGE